MLSKIPSWAVAVAGAAIVIIATATSTIVPHQTRKSINVMQLEIVETRRAVDRLWSSHLQADQRSASADVFFAQALGSDIGQGFLLEQAASQLAGAVLSMMAASGEPVPDVLPATIAAEKRLLVDGKAQGYVSLKSEIERLRLRSQRHINGRVDEIPAKESLVESLQARESRVFLAYVFCNLLGLLVTMCKDLPVWKVERHRAQMGA